MTNSEKIIQKADKKIAEGIIPEGMLKITNYYDNVIMLHKINPFFYDKAKLFWLWNKKRYCYEIVDEVDIMVLIDKKLRFGGQLTTAKVKSNYLEAFKQVGRLKQPEVAPKNWVQFHDQIINVETKKVFKSTPNYFLCNPIPHNIGKSCETPMMDKLFKEWVGKDYVPTLKEILAYCCLADYPIHRIFCFIGSGRNGKSQFQKIIDKFIGTDNVASACLDKLASPQQRFEKSKLYKKLVCLLGETNFGTMENTSTLKQLSGGDKIDYEFKNKNPFTDINYATIIVNSNSLPTSTDTSDGFYRRWVIVNFPNEFPEGKDIINFIPEQEYNNLAKMVVEKLPLLFDKGKFTNEGTIQERKENYIMASNPLPFFIKNFCNLADDLFVKATDLYTAYVQFLNANKRRKVSKKEFYNSLTNEGMIVERNNKRMDDGNYIKTMFVEGLSLKDSWKIAIKEPIKSTSQNSQNSQGSLLTSLRGKLVVKKGANDYSDYPKTSKKEKLIKTFNQLSKVSAKEVIFHIEKFGEKNSMNIENLKEDLKISDEFLEKLKQKGYVAEIHAGRVTVL